MHNNGNAATTRPALTLKLAQIVKAHADGLRDVRRGVCLLNAGRPDLACACFERAHGRGFRGESLPQLLVAALAASGRADEANDLLAEHDRPGKGGHVDAIRRAYLLAESGRLQEGIQQLRDRIGQDTENAELHFQLGLLLTLADDHDEAELRFTQTLSIDRDHTEALINLALCCGLRHAPTEAAGYLQRAQALRPCDARVGLLLAQAMKAIHQKGATLRIRAAMPDDTKPADEHGVDELSRIIENEPDFVDAFLSMHTDDVDDRVFAILLKTLQLALERQPEHAELRFHCARVLSRLGRQSDAIEQNELAVKLNPRFTRALIELGKLYMTTDCRSGALERLEQAVTAGADYADVHCLLGHLYREQGQLHQARQAYRRALKVNDHYEPAQQALAELLI